MEQQSRDVLVYLALMMDLPDVLSLCNTNSKINDKICNNNNFWRIKIKKDYPGIHNLDKYGSTYKQIYKNIRNLITINLDLNTIDQNIGIFPITFNREVMDDMGKFILYLVSTIQDFFDNPESNTFDIHIYNKGDYEKSCNGKIWERNVCLDDINYNTDRVVVTMNVKDLVGYNVEDIIVYFNRYIKYIRENFNIDTDKWPPIWL